MLAMHALALCSFMFVCMRLCVACLEASLEFGVEWNVLQQFCLAAPAVCFHSAFLWDIYLEVQVRLLLATLSG